MFKSLILLVFLCSNILSAQIQESCATDKQQKALFDNDSVAYKAYLASEKKLLESILAKKSVEENYKTKVNLKAIKNKRRKIIKTIK